ncbi:MAG: hypothetical protein ACTHN5_06195 [Phycisphaerae bacterium]
MAGFCRPGTICLTHGAEIGDAGTLNLQKTPAPRYSLWPELYTPGFLPAALGFLDAITEADKAEFAIIKKMPVYDMRRHPFQTVSQYVSFRTLYFGAPSTYEAYAAESDAELLTTQWVGKKRTRTLRSMIEFTNSPEKQKLFYRWVRKAYQRKYGDDVEVPELIRRGMSQELADQIAAVRGSIRVKDAHAGEFHAGGFNPRPVKYHSHYLLGTLSEHATGMAVDIDDSRNPQLTVAEWKFIEKLTGKTVNRSGRWGTEHDAEGLWKDIKGLSDLFVKTVAAEVKRVEAERALKKKEVGLGKAALEAGKQKTALQEVLGEFYGDLSPWVETGFIQLPCELVVELHGHGFKWGATFSTNVDLHHFELDEP